MRIKQGVIVTAIALIASTFHTLAIEELKISVECPNVILSWPSVEGELYIVQHRPTLDTNTPWVTLTNTLPAAIATNRTAFIHAGVVTGCSGESAMAGGQPSSSFAALTEEERVARLEELYKRAQEMAEELLRMLKEAIATAAANRERWKAEGKPSTQTATSSAESTSSGESSSIQSAPDSGFYQVVRDGVHVVGLTNLTNVTLSGSVNVAFEAGNAEGILDSAIVLVDGVKFAGANVLSVAVPGAWQFVIDTGFLENGAHTFQIEVTWQNPGSPDGNHVFVSRQSDPVTVSVSNQIYYPQWEQAVGEAPISAYFLKTTGSDVDWEIDIYDVGSNLVQTLTGHTTDGTITAYWNMVDMNGNTRTNADVDPEFSSIVTVSGAGLASAASRKTPPKKQKKRDWPDQG